MTEVEIESMASDASQES